MTSRRTAARVLGMLALPACRPPVADQVVDLDDLRVVVPQKILDADKREDVLMTGGTPVAIRDAPRAIALAERTPGSDTLGLRCGGTWLSEHWVMTAAHCHPRPGDVVIAGRTRLHPEGGGTVVGIDRVVVHPCYQGKCAEGPEAGYTTRDFDVALLHTARPIELAWAANAGVAWSLPVEADPAPGTPVRAFGWGASSLGDGATAELRSADLVLHPRATCHALHEGDVRPSDAVTDRMICTAPATKGPCGMDSGGPLVTLDSSRQVVGVIAWIDKYECGSPTKPAVYTNVGAVLDWIADTTGLPSPASPPAH